MINIDEYFCPNCNKKFQFNSPCETQKNFVQLDKKYQYLHINTFCNNCKKNISGIFLQKIILWLQQYQQYYKNYVKNYFVAEHKNYLYTYFPFTNDDIIDGMFKFVNYDKIDVIVALQGQQKYIDGLKKQICILPIKMFYCNQNNIFPNYLAQTIIINQSNKLSDCKLYSFYNTFFNKFDLLYGLNDWQKLKLIINND